MIIKSDRNQLIPPTTPSSLREFLALHPVFTSDEVARVPGRRGTRSPATLRVLLSRQRTRGRVVSVRRGVFAVVPVGIRPDAAHVDPYLVASRLAPDAVLGYHTALELHGHGHSVFHRFQFLTRTAARACSFRSTVYQPVRVARALADQDPGVQVVDRLGLDVRVTTLERTLVDALDRPDLCGGWEEVFRSLESIQAVEVAAVVEYALRLRCAMVAAKVGWFLELSAARLGVADDAIRTLRRRAPKSKQYIDRGSRHGHRLVTGWNLVVPTALADRRWDEE